MNEHDFFKKMIFDHAVNDAYVKARTKYATPRGFAWRKAVSFAAAAFVVLVGTVFLIPSARAEVLSWFGASTPQDYLTTDADQRTEIPEIESLITSPEASDGFRLIPIDRTNSKAVNSEGALKLSDFFYENSDIQLGDAMFDGETIYQSIHFNGLSGLYLLENWSGGTVTRVKVDPEALSAESALPLEFAFPDGWILYELADGTRIEGLIGDVSSALIDAYLAERDQKGLGEMSASDEHRQLVEAEDRAFLKKNGLTAVAQIYIFHPDEIEKLIDPEGNLAAKVFYEVDVVEEDRIGSDMVPPTELFKASLGTISINMRAYQEIKPSRFESVDAVVTWGPETVTLSRIDFDFGRPDNGYADVRIFFSKQRASTEGLTMLVEDIQMDALGVHDIKIRVRVPEAWTKEQREALAASLEFKTLINGESGQWFLNPINCTVQEDGDLLFSNGNLDEVPYDMLKSVREISFIPTLRTFTKVEPYDTNDKPLGALEPDYGEVVWSRPGVNGWADDATETEFPQYALVLKVK